VTQFFSYIISRFSSPKKISKIKNISFLLSYNSKPLTDINSLTKTPRPSYLNFKIFSTGSIFILAYCYIKDLKDCWFNFSDSLGTKVSSSIWYNVENAFALLVNQFPLSFTLLATHFQISSQMMFTQMVLTHLRMTFNMCLWSCFRQC
jgi:hypothetical protein